MRIFLLRFKNNFLKHLPEWLLILVSVFFVIELIFQPNFVYDYFKLLPIAFAFIPAFSILIYKTIIQAWPRFWKYTQTIILVLAIICLMLFGLFSWWERFFSFNLFANLGGHYIGFLYLTIMFFSFWLMQIFSKLKTPLKKKFFIVTLLIVLPFITYFLIESINDHHILIADQLFSKQTLTNSLLLMLIMIFFVALTNNLFGGFFITLGVTFVIALANYFKQLNRAQPLFFSDFKLWKDVLSLNNSYVSWSQLDLKWTELIIFILILSLLVYGAYSAKIRFKLKPKARLLTIVCSLFLIVGLVLSRQYVDLNFYTNISQLYKHNGLIVSLIDNHYLSKVQPPQERFSIEQIEDFIEDDENVYTIQNDFAEFVQPNIIAIMNESFFDIGDNRSQINTDKLLTYYNKFKKDGISGNITSPVFAGDTSVAEFEFLTGHDVKFLPVNLQPYVYFIKDEPTLALPWMLRERGYQTTAYHAFNHDFWNRDVAYPKLGFEKFVADEDSFLYENYETTYEYGEGSEAEYSTSFVSDVISSRMLIKDLIEEDKIATQNEIVMPQFKFLVTIQNHGPYNSEELFSDEERELVRPLLENLDITIEEYFFLSNYLLNLKGVDDGLALLYDYLTTTNRPTIVVFFGDHQPGFVNNEEIYERIGMTNEHGDILDIYTTQFFIWSNTNALNINEEDILPTQKEMAINELGTLLYQALNWSLPDYWQLTEKSRELNEPEIWKSAQYNILFENPKQFDTAGKLNK